jgi:3-oxoacyl-[acyl-carrier-protein] synthase II
MPGLSSRRVTVTGRGLVSPLGVGVEPYWQALMAGRTAVAPVTALARLGLPASRGAAVPPELIQPHLGRLPRKQQKLYNRATLLAMLAAALAAEDAALAGGAGDAARFGVLLGVNALAWDLTAMTQYVLAAESPAAPGTLDMALANAFCMRNINPLDYSLKTLPNLAAGHVAIAHDAQGVCRAMTEGPLGGAHAIGEGARLIQEGDLDVALCGGSDAELEEFLYATYCGAGLLATDAGDRAGFVAGEGSGVVLLEEGERARRRGAAVHAEVLAFAAAAGDGALAHEGDVDRLADRLQRVIEAVIEEAGDVPDVVSLHGDGAPAHEAAEATAVGRALGDRAATTPTLRLKAAHGHLGAASAAVEVLACSAMMRHDMIPPVAASRSVTFPVSLRRALVLSLGLFGECAALMLGRAGTP